MERGRMQRLGTAVLAAGLALAVGAAGNLPTPGLAATIFLVDVGTGGALKFTPKKRKIHVGDSVSWHLVEGTHTVTSGKPNAPVALFDRDPLTGEDFAFVFEQKGTVKYFCRIHGSAMTGKVVVKS